MNVIRVDRAGWYDFLDLSYYNFSSSAHVRVEIPGCLIENQVSQLVRLLRFHEGIVREEGLLLDILLAVEGLGRSSLGLYFWLGGALLEFDRKSSGLDYSTDSSSRIEGRDASSSRPDLLG